MATQQFFYDSTIRAWMEQIIRLFSNFTVEYGLDSNGAQMYSRIPVIWGDSTFNVATLTRLNSENIMPSVPLMSVYITDLKPAPEWRLTPTFVSTKSVRTREYDETTKTYQPSQNNAYTVQRLMPVPYMLRFKLDIVTSSITQKLQIFEQILPLFNPMIELQKNDNYLDWSSLSTVELKDLNYSNRTIPSGGSGTDSTYDIGTLDFETPIMLGTPAKVSKMGVIFKVITSLNELNNLDDLVMGTRQIVTFNNYGLYVNSDGIRILNQYEQAPNSSLSGQPLDWNGVLSAYGNIRTGVSQIGLSYDSSDNEILGTIAVSPTDSTMLLFNANSATLPANTLPAILGVVNPQEMAFSAPNTGDSYLLTADMGTSWPFEPTSIAVEGSPKTNDIVVFDGTSWKTDFVASNNVGNVNFVWDSSKNTQYQWNGNSWVSGWYGPYSNDKWRIII